MALNVRNIACDYRVVKGLQFLCILGLLNLRNCHQKQGHKDYLSQKGHGSHHTCADRKHDSLSKVYRVVIGEPCEFEPSHEYDKQAANCLLN